MSETTNNNDSTKDTPQSKEETAASASGASPARAPSRASLSRRSSIKKRRSSLFAAARASFYRTRGQSGASPSTLRGTSGADFEGYATVRRGAGEGMLEIFDLSNILTCFRCFGTCGNKNDLYYLLIKGYHCFVFKDEEGKSPKYAMELMNRKAVIQPSHATFVPHVPHPHMGEKEGESNAANTANPANYTTVHIETSLGDIEYEITLSSPTAASEFCAAVSRASSAASTEEVRKRLGHEQLLNKRSSVRYANVIGKEKTKEQPEVPLSTGEMLAGMPVNEYSH